VFLVDQTPNKNRQVIKPNDVEDLFKVDFQLLNAWHIGIRWMNGESYKSNYPAHRL
jgi:hypothetical protein